ncbi:MAG TPA: HAMP domain-containing sensor histidine kinase [Nitrospirota bacterium]|nr:HAMP domain-containing sensor histidine kinase [Nitrospirota bacterium]
MFKYLYTKLAAVLLGLFLVMGVLYILLTLYTTRLYFQEVNQKLNLILAQHLVSEKILLKNGKVDESALQNIFHMLMVVNPVIEVYLLGPDGTILAYSAPPGKVKRHSVSLEPVRQLLNGIPAMPVRGDDPRDLEKKKVFSAAPILLDGRTVGYLYIILGSEQFETAAGMLQRSYILRLSLWAGAGGLLFALLAALLLFKRMTLRLRLLTSSMEMFRGSDFTEHPPLPAKFAVRRGDEIDKIGTIFLQMAERMVRLIKDMTDADLHRREIVANITHDLRTPLTSLQGYLETLLMKADALTPEDQRQYLTIALKRSDQLRRLVTGLFELAKLDSPDIQVRFEPFHLHELIQDILQQFHLAAEDKKIALRMNIPDDVPLAFADIELTERVFENLIDNAIRHTPGSGAVTISATLTEARIKVTVSDTGSGMAPEDLAHLFDRNYRRERIRGGDRAGLGLIVVKRILELHHSTINVSSEINAGVTFTFFLPAYRGTSS